MPERRPDGKRLERSNPIALADTLAIVLR
jgi:hypothetical protein